MDNVIIDKGHDICFHCAYVEGYTTLSACEALCERYYICGTIAEANDELVKYEQEGESAMKTLYGLTKDQMRFVYEEVRIDFLKKDLANYIDCYLSENPDDYDLDRLVYLVDSYEAGYDVPVKRLFEAAIEDYNNGGGVY